MTDSVFSPDLLEKKAPSLQKAASGESRQPSRQQEMLRQSLKAYGESGTQNRVRSTGLAGVWRWLSRGYGNRAQTPDTNGRGINGTEKTARPEAVTHVGMGPTSRKLDEPAEVTELVSLKMARLRLLGLSLLFVLGFFVMSGRTLELGFDGEMEGRNAQTAPRARAATSGEQTRQQAADGGARHVLAHQLVPGVRASRADIVDRNGEILATSLETSSLAVNPRKVKDPEALAAALAHIIPSVSAAKFEVQLKSEQGFVWLHRQLTPRQKWAVNALGRPELEFHKAEERIYPHGTLAAHILGRTDIDGLGSSGIEKYFEDRLSDPGRVSQPLALSIDARVQYALADELSAAMRVQEAIGASATVMDVRTGEVIAAVSLPDFDPNVPGDPYSSAAFNRVTAGQYELGSIFKTFTMAGAFDMGLITMADGYDATKPLRAGRFLIRDDHPKKRYLTVPEIYTYSSNIGTALIALDMGQVRQEDFLRTLGFLSRPPIELPEVVAGRGPAHWNEVETMTISYGHGLAASPLQLVSAAAAMVNGGRLIPATLIDKRATGGNSPARTEADGTRVISKATSRKIRQLMRLAVTKGTGGAADAVGYRVGGKTGTAEKPGVGGYQRSKVLASFMAAFPMDDPQYVIFASLDEPKGRDNHWGFRSAGWTVAPVVRNSVMRIAPLLGIAPREEDETLYEQVALLIEEDD